MTSRTLRTCLGLVLAASVAGGTWVSVAAQAGPPKTPTAAPARKKPAASTALTTPVVPAPAVQPSPAAAPQNAARSAAGKKAAGATAQTGRPADAAPQAPAAVPDAPPAAAVERPPAAETYSYKSLGRRDPFISLVNRASIEKGPPQKRPEGLRGLSFDEIALRGVFLGRAGPIALVQGPDTKTYQVHIGDRMYDAVVRSITADSLVVLQEVNDPLSLQKQRERRKTLRVAEEVK